MSKTLFEISQEMKKSMANQTKKLNTIEDNIIDTGDYIGQSLKEIDITAEAQTSCNSLCKWLTFLIGLVMFIGIIIVYYFYWNNKREPLSGEMLLSN